MLAIFFIALNQEHGIRQLKARAYGSSIPHLDVHQIGCVLVPKLPEKERERIGEMGSRRRQVKGHCH